MKYISVILIIMTILPLVSSAADEVIISNCSEIKNACDINISKLLQDIDTINITKENLKNDSNYYTNLSDYYRILYENANAGITNKNLDNIYLTQYNLNQTYTELTQNFNNIRNWNIGLSVGLFGITIFEIVNRIKLFRKKKKNEKG